MVLICICKQLLKCRRTICRKNVRGGGQPYSLESSSFIQTSLFHTYIQNIQTQFVKQGSKNIIFSLFFYLLEPELAKNFHLSKSHQFLKIMDKNIHSLLFCLLILFIFPCFFLGCCGFHIYIYIYIYEKW